MVRVLAHEITELVGNYERAAILGFVVPDNLRFTKDIFIPAGILQGAVNRHKVLVEITDYGSKNKKSGGAESSRSLDT